ncbi:NTE family protein [Arthrobacter sp. SORGH_AS 212]|nr:NTE family protein [Arthrobacter sp. SORGH_AS_0212]
MAGTDATPRMPGSGERALVLGGGGSTGNAWLIGVMAGLSEAGLDVTDADLVIGTSAGSTAAAQISGATPAELLAAILDAPPQSRRPASDAVPADPAAPGPSAGGATSGTVYAGSRLQSGAAGSGSGSQRPSPAGGAVNHLERTGRIIAASVDAADMRRKIGAAALDLAADYDPSDRWRATVAARLPHQLWPDRYTLITAVDARTGHPVVFDRESGVDLVDAVAASCASGFAYSSGGGAYIDGGYRANAENADLASGYARVLVLSPFGGRSRTPADWGMHLASQVRGLRAGGSRVETVFPDSASEQLFGANAMDVSLRPAAARAGYQQGLGLAEELVEFWR